jgi:cytochrome c biogenesis protein CcmG/thiol:disulfide interchange protein DsbE
MGWRRLVYLLPVLIFVGVGVGLAVGLTRDPSTLPSALIDKPAPKFDLPPVEGLPSDGLSSADLKGGVSLVNVFASWCVPCRAEHPLLMGLAARGVVINGIDYKGPPEQAAPWLKELGNPFARIGADRSGRVAIDFGVYGVPETFVIDREGRIRHKYVGPLQARDIKESLLPMLDRLGRERELDPVVRTGAPSQ